MTSTQNPLDLLNSLESALALLQAMPSPPATRLEEAAPLPSLLEQCEAMVARQPLPLIRSIHHFAATGGTLISKCLDAQPNVVLLSEIDPLSLKSIIPSKPVFTPRSIIQQLRQSVRGNSDELVEVVFRAEISALRDHLFRQGRHLVVRDHPHSQYCFDPPNPGRKSVHDLLCEAGETRSVVTVRHPLDSFLSLTSLGWTHFSPATLKEYSRRYMAFLDDHAGLPIVKYETFVAAPEQTTELICAALELPYLRGALDLRDMFKLSGDSGRAGGAIAERPRKAIPAHVADEIGEEDYLLLCQRLGYDPAAEGGTLAN